MLSTENRVLSAGIASATRTFPAINMSRARGYYIALLCTALNAATAKTAACAVAAEKEIQDLTFTATTPGAAGNYIQMDYAPGGAPAAKTAANAVAALKVIQDLTFTAVTPGAAGNYIQLDYAPHTAKTALTAVSATKEIQDLTYTAAAAGLVGTYIQIDYDNDATAGSETVSVAGAGTVGDPYVVTVNIETGVSTAAQIKTAWDAHAPALALATVAVTGTGTDAQTEIAPTALEGGADSTINATTNEITSSSHGFSTGMAVQVSIGAEALPAPLVVSTDYWVTVTGADTFKLSASKADVAAGVFIDLTTGGAKDQTVTFTPTIGNVYLSGAGTSGDPYIILVTIESTVTTATDLKGYYDLYAPAVALATCAVSGTGGTAQTVISATALATGADSATNITTNVITTAAHSFFTGLGVRLTTSAGSLPTGLSLSTTYYVIRIDATTFKLATSFANAIAGTAIDITADGTAGATMTVTPYLGEVVIFGTGTALDPYIITITIADGSTTATALKAYHDGSAAALALATCAITGTPSTAQNVITPTALEGGTASKVNIATDTIETAAHGMITGQKVQLTTDGTLPTGLDLVTDYFIIRLSATTFQLAASHDDAVAETPVPVDITADGSEQSTVTITPVGGTISAKLQRAVKNDDSWFVDVGSSSTNISGTGTTEWEDTEFMAGWLRVVLTVPGGAITYQCEGNIVHESPLG